MKLRFSIASDAIGRLIATELRPPIASNVIDGLSA